MAFSSASTKVKSIDIFKTVEYDRRMEPVTVFSYVMLGILAVVVIIAGSKKFKQFIKDEIERGKVRQAREAERYAKLQEERATRARIRAENPTSSSGDDNSYLIAMAAAGLTVDSCSDTGSTDGGGDSGGGGDGGGGGGD